MPIDSSDIKSIDRCKRRIRARGFMLRFSRFD
jgi:hypothetical protein